MGRPVLHPIFDPHVVSALRALSSSMSQPLRVQHFCRPIILEPKPLRAALTTLNPLCDDLNIEFMEISTEKGSVAHGLKRYEVAWINETIRLAKPKFVLRIKGRWNVRAGVYGPDPPAVDPAGTGGIELLELPWGGQYCEFTVIPPSVWEAPSW